MELKSTTNGTCLEQMKNSRKIPRKCGDSSANSPQFISFVINGLVGICGAFHQYFRNFSPARDNTYDSFLNVNIHPFAA